MTIFLMMIRYHTKLSIQLFKFQQIHKAVWLAHVIQFDIVDE